jgi:hypothetical protein
MSDMFSPASSTKNFGWRKDPNRLHRSIRSGFSRRLRPVKRSQWRADSGLNDPAIELIPMDFFLYSKPAADDDYILVDQLVERAVNRPLDLPFFRLAIFAFHLANSGTWRKSLWPNGHVAGWANKLIREIAWQRGAWRRHAFERSSLLTFLREHVEATDGTLRKMRNNYWFMLSVNGIFEGRQSDPINLEPESWGEDAIQLFWDRLIFDGVVAERDDLRVLPDTFLEHEIYKLLGCDREFGLRLAMRAARTYSGPRMASRFDQLRELGVLPGRRAA